MGNSSTAQQLQVAIPSYEGEWIHQSVLGHCVLVKNAETGILAEQYSIPTDARIDRMQNYWIYEMRRTQTDNIVTVYQVQNQDNQMLCQGQDFIKVKTEYIPYRLSQLENISFPQAIYILREALIGYRAITDFCGAVRINDEMIGFTPQHRVKVWINENFACNIPPQGQQFHFRQPGSLEQRDPQTIVMVFQVIQQHIQGSQFPESFSRAFRQYPMQTFSQAIQFIQQYSSKEGIKQKQYGVKQTNSSVQFIQSPISQISTVKIQQQPIVKKSSQAIRLESKPLQNKIVQIPYQQSKVIIKQPQQQIVNRARIISNKHQIPKQLYYKPEPLRLIPKKPLATHLPKQSFIIGSQKTLPPFVRYNTSKNTQINTNKQIVLNHPNIINHHNNIKSRIHHEPILVHQKSFKQYISQSQVNDKFSTPIKYNSTPSTPNTPLSTLIKPSQPVVIQKNAFIKKINNTTIDCIPLSRFKYSPVKKTRY